MADGVTTQATTLATIPTATTIATDDAAAAGHVQMVKLAVSTNGSATPIPADADGLSVNVTNPGAIDVALSLAVTRIQVTPTVTATAYEVLDAIGGLMTFTNAAATSGGSIHLESVTIVDEDQQLKPIDLILFRSSIGAPTDEQPFDPTDAELLDCVGVVHVYPSDYANFSDNAVAHKDVVLTATLSGTSLYGVLVCREALSFSTTSSIHVTLTMVQD